MPREHLFLRVVLAWVCAGHVVLGLLALVSGRRAIRLGSRLYGAAFAPTDQFAYALRPLGAFMLALAFQQGLAIWQPQRYRGVIDATLAVLVLRQLQRIVHARDVFALFRIPPHRHWLATVFFILQAALLLLARLQTRWEPSSRGGGAPS